MKTIQLGITGHRILARTKEREIERGIHQALARIVAVYPSNRFVILSSLAEGADCLFVEEALHYLKAELIVVLPLPPTEYLEDFTNTDAKHVFERLLGQSTHTPVLMSKQASNSLSYLKAGEFIVENCDVLIAIWDGVEAQGEGGTADIVAWARRRDKPLVWIRAGNRRPGTLAPTHLGAMQGAVEFERLPESKPSQ